MTFYPYLDAAGYCESGGCPEIVHVDAPSSGGFTGALVAVLVGSTAITASGSFYQLGAAGDRRPGQVYLSPDPPPPQPSL